MEGRSAAGPESDEAFDGARDWQSARMVWWKPRHGIDLSGLKIVLARRTLMQVFAVDR
jgi:hypothetical protein